MKKQDLRPICNCGVYPFPHRIGGKCDGLSLAYHCFYYEQSNCRYCNLKVNNECQAITGQESIKEGDCWEYWKDCGEHIPDSDKEMLI